ncbi:MAG: 16S rRNA processing protein RimM [Sphingobacteriales bacterium]|nr:16S rRNA processing protein RimM [Sphingobacteriales bacterium]
MELIRIGKVLKTHGYKGNLKIYIDEFYMDDFEELSIIFINNLPYFITSKDINSESQAIILLEEIDSKEKAHPLQGKDIFAKDDDLTEILDEEEYAHLAGYELTDRTAGTIGTIEKIVELPFQFMAQIFRDKKEILIPLNDDFILKIDEKKKIVEMKLPDGFLDVF